jgi:hypothetical protein
MIAIWYAFSSGMKHKIAKLMLEKAGTFLERAEAVRVALSLGMPLAEIEEYLDWLDATQGPPADYPSPNSKEPPESEDPSPAPPTNLPK